MSKVLIIGSDNKMEATRLSEAYLVKHGHEIVDNNSFPNMFSHEPFVLRTLERPEPIFPKSKSKYHK